MEFRYAHDWISLRTCRYDAGAAAMGSVVAKPLKNKVIRFIRSLQKIA